MSDLYWDACERIGELERENKELKMYADAMAQAITSYDKLARDLSLIGYLQWRKEREQRQRNTTT